MPDTPAALWVPYMRPVSASPVHATEIPFRTLALSSYSTSFSSSSLSNYEEENHFSSVSSVGQQGGWNSVDEDDMYEVDIPPFHRKA